VRILAVVDSDSYVKWGAAVLAASPADWDRSMVLLQTPVAPSGGQLAAALGGSGYSDADVARVSLAALADLVRTTAPDVVFLSLRGPVAVVVFRALDALPGVRPVYLTGLPGISVPATRKAIRYRSWSDLFLLGSKREIREFDALAAELETPMEFALSTLPFVAQLVPPEGVEEGSGAVPSSVIFAAQAIVPRERSDRLMLLGWLRQLALRHRSLTVVIKVRAVAGEAQTHEEADSFPDLLGELPDVPPNLVVASGPMSRHLDGAAGLVTVSSTAALEAVARGVPVIVLDDFGVGPEQINEVFIGSGLLAGSDALMDAAFRTVDAGWLDDNYFHPGDDNTWTQRLLDLVADRSAGRLPDPVRVPARGGRLREVWDRKHAFGRLDRTVSGRLIVLVWLPARTVVRALRQVIRWSNDLGTKRS